MSRPSVVAGASDSKNPDLYYSHSRCNEKIFHKKEKNSRVFVNQIFDNVCENKVCNHLSSRYSSIVSMMACYRGGHRFNSQQGIELIIMNKKELRYNMMSTHNSEDRCQKRYMEAAHRVPTCNNVICNVNGILSMFCRYK